MQKDVSNYFSRVPENLFNALTGVNRQLMGASLTLLYENVRFGTSYTLTAEDAQDAIEEMIEQYHFRAESEEEDLSDAHQTAMFVLRRLRACGWIEEEIGEDYQRLIHFEDYAAELMQTMRRISTDETDEYSGYIFTVYQLLTAIRREPGNGDVYLERAAAVTEDLFRQLAALNTSIKKYIQRLLDEKNRNDLPALMTMLLDEYQAGVVDRAYYNLTTKDHPDKYQRYILHAITDIEEDAGLMDMMTRQNMERKGIGYEESIERLQDELDRIRTSFEGIPELMEEIDRKNRRYVSSALARITFLMEAHDDLEGKINRILKEMIKGNVGPEEIIRVCRIAYADSDSLYTPKKKRMRVKVSYVEEMSHDDAAIAEFAALLAEETKFSRAAVEEYFLELLKDKKEIRASQMRPENFENFTYMILGYLYGSDETGKLQIENLEESVHAGGYRFRDFIIREKQDG